MSETFIRNQISAMGRWRPTLLGSLRVDSPIARPEDPVVFDRSFRDRMALFWAALTGRSQRIRKALHDTRPDLVHAHFAKDAWLVLHACRKLRLPLVVTVHGYDVTALPQAGGIRGAVSRYRTRAVLKRADRIVAVSKYIRHEAIRWGAPARNTRLMPIGVPISSSQAAVCRVVDVVFVGRFVAKKGVFDALQAVAAQSNASALRCEVIGDGPLRTEAERVARSLGLNVTFTGALPPERVAERLSRARVLLAPSRRAPNGDAEGFGMVFLEAALFRVPAVAYRHGGVPEAVVDGVTGLLAREGDVEGLSFLLSTLLENEEVRAGMGDAAYLRVRGQFNIVRRTRQLERLFDRLLDID